MTTSLSAGGTPRLAPVVDRIGRGLDVLSLTHGRAVAALLVLCLIVFLPGQISLQPMDRDEPRFAQASKQMLETGDFVDIRFQGEARHKKPVGIYWAQAAAVAAGAALGVPEARTQIALYRIPSLIGATASVLLAYWAALAFLPRRSALLAAALYGGCLMLAAEAHLAKTDALLASLRHREPRGARPGPAGVAGRRAGAVRADLRGVLARHGARHPGQGADGAAVRGSAGPDPVDAGCAPAAGSSPCAPGPASPSTLLLVAPWFAAIAWKSGGAFYAEAVGHDMLAKVGGGAERHWATARPLRARLLRDLLAGRGLRRHESALRVARAARTGRIAS